MIPPIEANNFGMILLTYPLFVLGSSTIAQPKEKQYHSPHQSQVLVSSSSSLADSLNLSTVANFTSSLVNSSTSVSRPTSIYATTPRNAASRSGHHSAYTASRTAHQRAEWLKGLHCNSVDSMLGMCCN